jgi:uncharacterized damage-inducible protein DinB
MKALLLAQFDAEMRLTRAVLDAVPADHLDWTPHDRAFPLGRLAMHVATIPGWMRAFTEGDGYDMGPSGPGPATPTDLAQVTAAFVQAEARGRAALDACPDSALLEPWILRRHGAVLSTMPRAEAVSRFGLRHLVHHRGQLTVYLRWLGVPVPALYGDSADAQLAPDEPDATR